MPDRVYTEHDSGVRNSIPGQPGRAGEIEARLPEPHLEAFETMRNFLRLLILPTLLSSIFSGVLGAAEPAIAAVMNNYSWMLPGLPNYGIAPGSIFTIFGTGMGPHRSSSRTSRYSRRSQV